MALVGEITTFRIRPSDDEPMPGESLLVQGLTSSMNSNFSSNTGSAPPGASLFSRGNSVSGSNRSINSTSGTNAGGCAPPGASLMYLGNSMSGSNRSVNSNSDSNYVPPGASTLPNPRHNQQQQQQPGSSTLELNRSLSSSEGGANLPPAGSSMLNLDRSRSLSNTSNNSISNYPAGTSIMNLNCNSVPGQSTLNLNRSISAQSSNSVNLPGAECLQGSTQTLPMSRPQLLPGISVIESDECHSAPVTTCPSSFNFTHQRSASTRVAGTSMLNINGAQSTMSIVSSGDDGVQSFRLQPGLSILDNHNFETASQLSTSPEMYTTALMDFKTSETRPAETRPAETRPAETRPAETRTVETRPAETRPAEPSQARGQQQQVLISPLPAKDQTSSSSASAQCRECKRLLGKCVLS